MKWNDNNNGRLLFKRIKIQDPELIFSIEDNNNNIIHPRLTKVKRKRIMIIEPKGNKNASGSHTSDHGRNKILITKCLLLDIDVILIVWN